MLDGQGRANEKEKEIYLNFMQQTLLDNSDARRVLKCTV